MLAFQRNRHRRATCLQASQWLIALLLVALGLCAHGKPVDGSTAPEADKQTRAPIHIAVSIEPLALLVEQLFGDQVTVTTLLPPVQDHHHHNLRFSQMRSLRDAEMVVWVGSNLETGLADAIGQANQVLTLQTLPVIRDAIESANGDAHVWLSPALAVEIGRALTDRVAELRPDQKQELLQRFHAFKRQIDEIESKIDDLLRNVQSISYIDDHNALAQFAGYFGLSPYGALHDAGGSDIGPRAMAELIRRAEHSPPDCLMVEVGTSKSRSSRLAERLNTAAVTVDPMAVSLAHDDQHSRNPAPFGSLLMNIAESFRECGFAAR
ncbi:MAG: metal ABC transporter substrate-binding protein [bacterium]